MAMILFQNDQNVMSAPALCWQSGPVRPSMALLFRDLNSPEWRNFLLASQDFSRGARGELRRDRRAGSRLAGRLFSFFRGVHGGLLQTLRVRLQFRGVRRTLGFDGGGLLIRTRTTRSDEEA